MVGGGGKRGTFASAPLLVRGCERGVASLRNPDPHEPKPSRRVIVYQRVTRPRSAFPPGAGGAGMPGRSRPIRAVPGHGSHVRDVRVVGPFGLASPDIKLLCSRPLFSWYLPAKESHAGAVAVRDIPSLHPPLVSSPPSAPRKAWVPCDAALGLSPHSLPVPCALYLQCRRMGARASVL